MDSRKPFNHYVRSKHSGLSPFRTNFNMGTQFLLASSRQLTDTQPGTSVGGLPGRSGSTVLSSIQNHPTGAIPKKNVNKNLPRNVNQRKENRHETVDRNRRRLRADAPNVVPEPSLSFRTPSPSVIIITEPDNGPSFHRERLKAETEWLLERADYWTTVKTDVPDLPNWVVETIDIAVGGIRLMVNSKFKQFEKLIEHCASRYKLISRIPIAVSSSSRNSPAVVYSGQSSAASPPVLPEDLDGFWDTMYLQVQSLRNRLEILEKAKANNWNDPRVVPANKREIRPKNSNKVVPFPSKGRSKFREFLKNKQISSGLPGPVQEEPAKEVPLEALPNEPNEARCLTPRRHQDLIRSSFGFVSDTPRNGPATPMPSTPWRSFTEGETDEVFTDVKFSPLATSVMPEEGAFGGADRRESAQVPAPKVLTPFAARNLKKAENFSRRTSVGVVMRLSLLGRLSRDETVLHTFENPDSE